MFYLAPFRCLTDVHTFIFPKWKWTGKFAKATNDANLVSFALGKFNLRPMKQGFTFNIKAIRWIAVRIGSHLWLLEDGLTFNKHSCYASTY